MDLQFLNGVFHFTSVMSLLVMLTVTQVENHFRECIRECEIQGVRVTRNQFKSTVHRFQLKNCHGHRSRINLLLIGADGYLIVLRLESTRTAFKPVKLYEV